MRFRPCIDLRGGLVVQIVGGSLRDGAEPVENYVSERPPAWFARRYRQDGLLGGHVIALGPGNDEAIAQALAAHPNGLQVGGGVTPDNAERWLEAGAAAVIATSFLFDRGRFREDRLRELRDAAGRERLVLDLSCAPRQGRYFAMADRWQTPTDLEIEAGRLAELAQSCSELLVHATEQEGRRAGIDAALVELLAEIAPCPATYAGGIRGPEDVAEIERRGRGRLDFTVGSALDLFGGDGVRYADLVERYGPASPARA